MSTDMEVVSNDVIENHTISEEYTEIIEGKAKILFPKSNTVFYNNVQVFNRDLSVAAIKYFIKLYRQTKKPATNKDHDAIRAASTVNTQTHCPQDENYICINKDEDIKGNNIDDNNKLNNENDMSKNINILEALSATGLRAVRYGLEIPNVHKIIANDFSKEAVNNINRNINHNGVCDIVKSANADASMLLYEHRFPLSKRFEVIDLDPYGSPVQFLDGAVQAIQDGGLLCVTCTDMGALCGNHGEAAYAKYGGLPIRAKYCHEMALRIVLACLDSHAGRYKRYIKPLLSMSADFYIRLFVRVFTSASEVKCSASKKAYVFHCNGCETYTLQPVGYKIEEGNSKKYKPGSGPVVPQKCDQCGHTFKICGPIWSEPMHDVAFLNGLLHSVQDGGEECYKTYDRIVGVLNLMSEELQDQPLYLVIDNLCNILHCPTPSQPQFYSALLHAGYKVSGTHANEAGFKTDAPISVIWDILRCWVKDYNVKSKKITERSPAAAILSKVPQVIANFEILPEATPLSKIHKLSRFPLNPETDWGPKSKAKQNNTFSCLPDKRTKLQGKRHRNSRKPDFKQFACKRFKRGECTLGDDCKYSHQVGNTETTKTDLLNNMANVVTEFIEESLDTCEIVSPHGIKSTGSREDNIDADISEMSET